MTRPQKHVCNESAVLNELKPNFLKQSLLVENITHCYD